MIFSAEVNPSPGQVGVEMGRSAAVQTRSGSTTEEIEAKVSRIKSSKTSAAFFTRGCVGSVGQLIKIAMLRVKNALPFLEC
jgi:hypothetical protein